MSSTGGAAAQPSSTSNPNPLQQRPSLGGGDGGGSGGGGSAAPPTTAAAGGSGSKGGGAATTKSGKPPPKKKTVRRKKKTPGTAGSGGASGAGGGGGGGSSSSAAASRAQNAQLAAQADAAAAHAEGELAGGRERDTARRNDAAWTTGEVVATAATSTSPSSGGHMLGSAGLLSEETAIIDRALQANGLKRSDVTPQAYGCLLEHARRYACELIADAQDLAWHSNRREVEGRDLQLAFELRDDASVDRCLPPRSALLAAAEEVNRVPLPCIPGHCYRGLVLPPPEHQLTARTFDVVSSARAARRVLPSPPTSATTGGAKDRETTEGSGRPFSSKKSTASYGANKGKQIAVNLKSSSGAAGSGAASGGGATGEAGTPAGGGGTAGAGGGASSSAGSASATTAGGERGSAKRKVDEM